MKIVIQRVTRACVRVGGEERAAIGPGLVLLVGVEKGDGAELAALAATKIAHLRIFPSERGVDDRMNRSVLEAGGEILVVSQFTLAGSMKKGRRPGFDHAAAPAEAEAIYLELADRLRHEGARVATGVFRAMMEVDLVNDGPVTFVFDTAV